MNGSEAHTGVGLRAAFGSDLWQFLEVRMQEGPATGLPGWKIMDHLTGVSYGWKDMISTISPNVTVGKPLPSPKNVT